MFEPRNDSPEAQQTERLVWENENRYWDSAKQLDANAVMNLFSSAVQGWGAGAVTPASKPQIEAAMKERFAQLGPKTKIDVKLTRHSSRVFSEHLAEVFYTSDVTYRFEKDGKPEVMEMSVRIYHLWGRIHTS